MAFKSILSFFLSVITFFGYTFSFPKTSADAKYINPNKEVQRDMDKYVGVHSEIKDCGGVPALFVNGKPFTSTAYMTYLEEFNEYNDFTDAGYSFFSVPVLFTGKWISRTEGFKPFTKGIFDEKGKPDFSVLDNSVRKILSSNPDANIIPRVNISMPEWWLEESPDSTTEMVGGITLRESLYSDKWRTDTAQMLREFIRYVNTTDYASHIIGYQIAGGNTEEWFHFDLNAGCCKNAEKGFKEFLNKYYPEIEYKGLPDLSLLNKKTNYFKDEYLTRFLEYASFAVANAITYFARVAKEETGNNVVVGSFYGYSLEVTNPLWGSHALKILLNDKNIDFICSPNSYIGNRSIGIDWTEMYPADSVRLHGKMCFQECDIRTHLTVHLNEKDPTTDPNHNLNGPIWDGLETKEQSINAIRKSFCRQLIKGNGLWWFDMWGGWYADNDIMSEMKQFREIYAQSLSDTDRSSKSELAVFVDESAYKYMTNSSLRNALFNQRKELGLIGTTYDIFDISDFDRVYRNYKAVIFMSGTKTDYLKSALASCKKENLPYLISTELKQNFSVKELKAFCKSNGVRTYIESEDIIYINNNYVALCATSDGKKTVKLDKEYNISQLLGNGFNDVYSDSFTVEMKKGETILFRLEA